MFKKAQGLPITTIVLILISLLVLVTLAIFFFGQIGQTSSGATDSQCVAKCQSLGAIYAQHGIMNNIDPDVTDTNARNFCNSCPTSTCAAQHNGKICVIGCKDSTSTQVGSLSCSFS